MDSVLYAHGPGMQAGGTLDYGVLATPCRERLPHDVGFCHGREAARPGCPSNDYGQRHTRKLECARQVVGLGAPRTPGLRSVGGLLRGNGVDS